MRAPMNISEEINKCVITRYNVKVRQRKQAGCKVVASTQALSRNEKVGRWTRSDVRQGLCCYWAQNVTLTTEVRWTLTQSTLRDHS